MSAKARRVPTPKGPKPAIPRNSTTVKRHTPATPVPPANVAKSPTAPKGRTPATPVPPANVAKSPTAPKGRTPATPVPPANVAKSPTAPKGRTPATPVPPDKATISQAKLVEQKPANANRTQRESVARTIIPRDYQFCLNGKWSSSDTLMEKGEFTRDDLDKVPREQGIYELRVDNEPVYLGQAKNLNDRVCGQHARGHSHLQDQLKAVDQNSKVTVRYRTTQPLCDLPNLHELRGVPTDGATAAQLVEASLLAKYDYKWNAQCNGERRE